MSTSDSSVAGSCFCCFLCSCCCCCWCILACERPGLFVFEGVTCAATGTPLTAGTGSSLSMERKELSNETYLPQRLKQRKRTDDKTTHKVLPMCNGRAWPQARALTRRARGRLLEPASRRRCRLQQTALPRCSSVSASTWNQGNHRC